MIVHDMGSPLTALTVFLDLLQANLTEDHREKQEEYLFGARKIAKSLGDMARQALDLSRLESPEIPMRPAQCELGALVQETISGLQSQAGTTEIIFELPSLPVQAYCDAETTRRIVANLLGNALKWVPSPGGSIRIVVVEQRHDRAVIGVSDNGPGIPPEYHKKIFDKFGQVGARQSSERRGVGLGLTFCKLAVEAQCGEIWVESAVGAGSTFWVSLPTTSLNQRQSHTRASWRPSNIALI